MQVFSISFLKQWTFEKSSVQMYVIPLPQNHPTLRV